MNDKPQVITVYLSKGGVAKSTLAALLAKYLAGRGHNTVLIDLDRQGSQSAIFDLIDEEGRSSEVLHLVLKRRLDMLAAITPIDPSMIPAIDGATPGRLGVVQGGSLTPLAVEEIKNNPFRFHVPNTLDIIRAPIMDLGDAVDYVVLDMGPSDQVLSIGGLMASDWIVMPTETGKQSVERIAPVLDEIDTAHDNGATVKVAGIVSVKTRHYFGGLRTSKSVQIGQAILEQAYSDLLLKDDLGEVVELPFDEDWDLVRYTGESLLGSELVKKKTKQAARRFLDAVWYQMGVNHAEAIR